MIRLYPAHCDDLKRSGLSDAMIASMKIVSHSKVALSELLGRSDLDSSETGYVIPYFTKDGESTDEWNARLMHGAPSTKPGKRSKYLRPSGTVSQLYWPPGCAALIKEHNYCLVTEGEKKAAKAVQEGFPCIAIAGVWNWMDNDARLIEKSDGEGTSYKTRPMSDLLNLADNTKLILLFDSDAKTNKNVRRALYTLRDALIFHGASWVRLLDMPAPKSEIIDKVGLDDFLIANGGREQLDSVIAQVLTLDSENISPLVKFPYSKGRTGKNLHYIIPNSTPKTKRECHVIWKECELLIDEGVYEVVLKVIAHTRIWCSRVIVDLENGPTWYEVGFVPLHGYEPAYRIGDASLLNPSVGDHRYASFGAFILPNERLAIAEVFHACQSSSFAPVVPGTATRGWVTPDPNKDSLAFVLSHGVITEEGFFHRDSRKCPLIPVGTEADGTVLSKALRRKGDAKYGAITMFQQVLRHPLPALMCAASVAGFLRHIVPDSENFIVHIFGESSGGKTTALRAAASLYGCPDDLIKQWRTTANGLEATLANRNDFAVFLDESGQQDDEDVLMKSAYLISNGGQKSRATKEGTEQKTGRFRLVALSTGEHALLKGSINAGQEVRVLQLPADMCGPLWGETDPSTMEQLRVLLDTNCGWALEPIVQEILKGGAVKRKSLETEMQAYCDAYRDTCPNASSTVKRRAKHLALLTLAYRVLLKVCLDIHDDRSAEVLIKERMLPFVNAVKAKMLILHSDQFGEGESKTLIRHIYEQLERNRSKIVGMTDNENIPDRWGHLVGKHLGIMPSAIDKLIHPYDRTRMLGVLDRENLLVFATGKKRKDLKHSLRIGKNQSSMWMYVVDWELLVKAAQV